MKIKKIEKLCKDYGQISKVEVVSKESIIRGEAERAFLGSDSAKYRIGKILWEFEPENFADLWGISSKQQEKMFMDSEVANLSDKDGEIYRDSLDFEFPIVPVGFSFSCCGVDWTTFKTEKNEFVFIPSVSLSPVEIDDDETSFWIRENYMAIKKGLYLEGIVRIPEIATQPFLVEALKRIYEISEKINVFKGEEENG